MVFICISGQAQHGKDTFGGYLSEYINSYDVSSKVIHYADLLKYICKTFFNWDGEKDLRGRSLLQHIGTDVVRQANPNYWVDFIVDMAELFPEKWEFFVIPDTRFPNEIERIRERGHIVLHVRVVRQGFDNALSLEQKLHMSENALNDVDPDIWIFNKDINELKKNARELARKIIYKEI